MASSQFRTTNELIEDAYYVNIDDCPPADAKHPANIQNQLTIGDLHANGLKLLYFLVRQNVLEISSTDYATIVRIYLKSAHALTKQDLVDSNNIIANAKVNPVGTIRLLGDELADRGENDYFVLKILEKLSKENISIEILLSNH